MLDEEVRGTDNLKMFGNLLFHGYKPEWEGGPKVPGTMPAAEAATPATSASAASLDTPAAEEQK